MLMVVDTRGQHLNSTTLLTSLKTPLHAMANTEDSARLRTVTFGYEEQRASLTVLCERTEFVLQASPTNLVSPAEGLSYQQLLKAITTVTEPIEYGAAVESLRNAVLTPFLSTIETLATRFEPGRDLTVREWAECNRFQLSLQHNHQIVVTGLKHAQLSRGLVSLPIPNLTLPSTVPQFDASEVNLDSYDSTAATTTGTWPIKATAAGKTHFFKAAIELRYPEFAHELNTYVALHNLGNPIPRIPVLTGVVVTSSLWVSEIDRPTPAETTCPFILGFLITWIDDAVVLADVSRQDRTLYMDGWRATVRETVEGLHSREILWGDVNAHNVVVDRGRGAWVVDLGRGGEGMYGRAEVVSFDGGDDLDRDARRKAEMKKEINGIDAMMEALLHRGPGDSRGLGPFYLHEG
jgi:hypothetical protein